MQEYDFKTIEQKWQKIWEDEKYGQAEDFSEKPKHYNLIEFPYPSGTGLHVGHCMAQGASDAYCRMKRMQGYNVMYPIGWDAFGLPTENFAIKNKMKPQKVAADAISTFTKQIKSLGYAFEWSREVNTTDPAYYKWTQWIFLQFYKHAYIDGKLIEVADDDTTTPRMAFQAEMPVNWCPSCKIVLANEEVVAGECERCGTQSEKRKQKQWMLRITSYADRLINDLDIVDYLDKIKTQQINWIGKSVGSDIDFKVKNSDFVIRVFTTRADTLYGCTYVVLAPEHPLVEKLKGNIENLRDVEKYVNDAKKKSDLERTEIEKDKTGVELKGIKAINPINHEEVSVWVADYCLASYGTGAVMAVPAHDDRDFEFAKKYGIEIKEVIIPKTIDKVDPPKEGVETVFRNAVQVIITNPKNDTVLCLKWKKFPWTTFVTGGIDEGEDIIAAAKREVLEETGYKNIKLIRTLGGPVESHFFAAHKNENRKAMFTALVFELENDEKIAISDKETETHEIHWVTWKELQNDKNVKCAEYDVWIDRFFNSEHAFTDYGVLINSDKFDGLESVEAKKQITEKVKNDQTGDFSINFKIRDWIFSRQHYWGEPIPIIHCEKCGALPIPENQLPVELPPVENYEPTDTGESPLAKIDSWVNVKCPKCGGKARRETDTMPNWAGSSWYFLHYADAKNDHFFTKPDYFRPEIAWTEKDKNCFETFKKIYTDLDKLDIKVWASNRFLLNGLNKALWLPFRRIALMAFKNNEPEIQKYLLSQNFQIKETLKYGNLYTKDEIELEIIEISEEQGKLFSYSFEGAIQYLTKNDLPEIPIAYLNGFCYRVVVPSYNFAHYKYIDKNENESRKGLGDTDKIEFLEKYMKSVNEKVQYWMPVDLYNGGMEHTTLHLLYSRFWHKFLFDLGVVPGPEPYAKRIAHGIILGPDGQKMSKSKGNVINPDEMVEKFGADSLRAYIMFIGPYDQESAWNMAGIMGVHRFLKRVWINQGLVNDIKDTDTLLVKINQTIKGITEDLENFQMNTVVSKLMEMNNTIEKEKHISKESFMIFLQLLYPACPHIASELWEKLGEKDSIEKSIWPKPDEKYLVAAKIEIAVQINGKTRQIIEIKSGISQSEAENQAKSNEKIADLLKGQQIKKIIYVSGRILNFVV